MSDKLPTWPVRSEYVQFYVGTLAVTRRERNYERARADADAAIERPRVAVNELSEVSALLVGGGDFAELLARRMRAVREAIDPLPPAEVDETERGGA